MNRHESPNKYPLRTCLYYKKNDLVECLIILLLSYFYILVTMVFTMVFTMVLPWFYHEKSPKINPKICPQRPQASSHGDPWMEPRPRDAEDAGPRPEVLVLLGMACSDWSTVS
jgi:hypothetical protein